jgi:hypothetical protein
VITTITLTHADTGRELAANGVLKSVVVKERSGLFQGPSAYISIVDYERREPLITHVFCTFRQILSACLT